MKTKKDILKILEKNPYGWCRREVDRAINCYLPQFSDEATLQEIAEGIPESWAFQWGKDVGDRKIMKAKITSSEFAFRWGFCIGDRKYMKNKITEKEWIDLWRKCFGEF